MIVMLSALALAPGIANGAETAAGKAVFQAKCQSCHGEQGQGNERLAKMLKVTIPQLGSAQVQDQTDEQLAKVVTEGKGKMPAVHNLSKKEVDEVIAFVRTLKTTK